MAIINNPTIMSRLPDFITEFAGGSFVPVLDGSYATVRIPNPFGEIPKGILFYTNEMTDSDITTDGVMRWALYVPDAVTASGSTTMEAARKSAFGLYDGDYWCGIDNGAFYFSNEGINTNDLSTSYIVFQITYQHFVAGKTWHWLAWV